MSVMWFALLFHNKLLKMGKKVLFLSDMLWTHFCFYLHCPVLVPTKSTERWRRSKPPLQKMAINSATWIDIRRVWRGNSEILEEKEVKCFIMYREKYFQKFGLQTVGHASPELSCSITTQESRRFLHRTNIKKDSNLNSVVHQMFHI